jgi:hypothetical protein
MLGIIIYMIIAGLVMSGFYLENQVEDTKTRVIIKWWLINLVIGFITLPMLAGSFLAKLNNKTN